MPWRRLSLEVEGTAKGEGFWIGFLAMKVVVS
jgi:hypothetical protein